MPTKIRLAEIKRWNGFSAAEPSERVAYVKLNRQTTCPPRAAVPVHSRMLFGISFNSQHPVQTSVMAVTIAAM